MKKYINNHGILAFTHEGEDYISNIGDEIELPDCEYVKCLEAKGYIILKQSKKK